jgi:polyferredoxin
LVSNSNLQPKYFKNIFIFSWQPKIIFGPQLIAATRFIFIFLDFILCWPSFLFSPARPAHSAFGPIPARSPTVLVTPPPCSLVTPPTAVVALASFFLSRRIQNRRLGLEPRRGIQIGPPWTHGLSPFHRSTDPWTWSTGFLSEK